jgi:hypothetical protein
VIATAIRNAAIATQKKAEAGLGAEAGLSCNFCVVAILGENWLLLHYSYTRLVYMVIIPSDKARYMIIPQWRL